MWNFGSHEPQFHMVDQFVVHVFFVVHINHKWFHHVDLWFMCFLWFTWTTKMWFIWWRAHYMNHENVVYVVGVVHVFLKNIWKNMWNRIHMVEEKTHEHGKSGSCKNLGLHGGGRCGLYVFVVHVVETNVVHVKRPQTHGGPICGSCEPKKTHKPQKGPPCEPKKSHEPQMGPPCVCCGSHEPQFHMVDPFCGLCEPQIHMVEPFVVYVNHKNHMNHKWVHHVFLVVHMNHNFTWWTHFVVYVNHKSTWWNHL